MKTRGGGPSIEEAIYSADDFYRNLDGLEVGEPTRAAKALLTIADKLERGEVLYARELAVLVKRLRKAAEDPIRARKHLGLGGEVARPLKTQAACDSIAARVSALRMKGLPLRTSRKKTGAFDVVAAEEGVTARTIERAWKNASLRVKGRPPKK